TRVLVLDTNNLAISRITRDGITATWSYGPSIGDGQPLRIDIEPSTREVKIEYTTSASAPGLNWNTEAQSYGRQRPYLYSLNEPNDARSWIPIQDTPTVRMTYDATLHVPADLLALMSAENNARTTNDTGVYSFTMTRPIPAYLIAIAVARLEFREFDERTGVYAEPELIDDAEWELQYLPAMVDAAETVAGPFPFTRHDVLLMPPTFIVGGMEHPMLNFINPFSVVSGNHPADPDEKNLIAHELAHSWAGDATTLGSWEDIWLNEGITSYLALRTLELMQGSERTDLQFYLDRNSYTSYANQTQDKSATTMHRPVPYAGYGFSNTSYVKGELFMKTLEDRIGRVPFDAFLKKYFETFAFRWVDDRNFLALLRSTIAFDEQAMRVDEWVYGTGVPSNITAPTSSVLLSRAQQRATAFNNGTPFSQLNPQTWSDVDIDLFVQIAPMNASRMAEIDAALGLSLRVTPPLSWLVAAGYANYTPALPAIERALMRGGPNSWITTIYRALSSTSSGRTRALDIFSRARDRYHDNIENSVNQILNSNNANLEENAA
ncbi:MAG TPA: leukotriene A4 hydrolase C-terminal domain-containing protein, partial [Thermoanaerobaculia bacterium]